jgi:prophage maintenance system killer protein
MKVSKEEIIRLNHGFGGALRNDSSIDYALQMQESKKIGIYKKLAYLWRAILVDHPFTDGNKRTASVVALMFADEYKKQADRELITHHIISIAKQNITEIRNIEWRLKNAIR